MAGQLYLVPTPIGNLKDITYRAVETLKQVDFILAEDTRKTGQLLKHYQIDKKMYAYHQHNEHKKTRGIIKQLERGYKVALVSSAGSPGISDPGYLIIKSCIEHNIKYTCLPGPTAIIPALTGSGLPMHRFCFEGFLPRKKGRHSRLQELAQEERTLVFYIPPHRLLKTINEFIQYFGANRQVTAAKEISKIYEDYITGSLQALKNHFEDQSIKGEYVLVVKGKE